MKQAYYWAAAAVLGLSWQVIGLATDLGDLRATPTCPPMLVRYFALTKGQTATWERLAADMPKGLLRNWQPSGAREQRAAADIRAFLEPAQQAMFDQGTAALDTYWQALQSANEQFRSAWNVAFGGRPSWKPRSWEALAARVAGLPTADQTEFGRTWSDLLRRRRIELKEFMKRTGLNPNRDRAAYIQAQAAAEVELKERFWLAELPALRQRLSPPSASKLKAADDAYHARKAAVKAGLEQLGIDLRGVFGPT